MNNYGILARVTGLLIEDESILLVKHTKEIGVNRFWSLPGGNIEQAETLDAAMKREMDEETGLEVEIIKLLYVCDKLETKGTRVHFLFLLKRTGGTITLPSNQFDDNNITEVKFIKLTELADLHFSEKFMNLALVGFPDAGSYVGDKSNIGL